MLRTTLVTIILTLMLSACGGGKWGFPYRPDIQQGNWVTAEKVSQLESGMSREQVRYILGTPTLQNVFRSDRWDYPYYNKPGYGTTEKRQFTVWFEGDSLSHWSGDDQPNHQPFQKPDPKNHADDESSTAPTEPTPSASAHHADDPAVFAEPLD
ncbi:MAG TPA: outer membrane protein assembly factor BamE [Burkholderiaceae bacterium]|nr:outer membrane protein assembly factor BamE [Burkholderiaceae bacterium]